MVIIRLHGFHRSFHRESPGTLIWLVIVFLAVSVTSQEFRLSYRYGYFNTSIVKYGEMNRHIDDIILLITLMKECPIIRTDGYKLTEAKNVKWLNIADQLGWSAGML